MMVSGIGTSSGFEERIRFSEIEIVDSNAIDTGVMHTLPEGNYINGWDVNVAGVRVTSAKRTIRKHKHAEFILRVKKRSELEYFIGRRYSDFAKLHRQLQAELPGKTVPGLPKKNKSDMTTTNAFTSVFGNSNDSDASSVSSVSTQIKDTNGSASMLSPSSMWLPAKSIFDRANAGVDHRAASIQSARIASSPRSSVEGSRLSPMPPTSDKSEVNASDLNC